ncbi:hypothetical protein GOV14_03695 [Candidatus Pacearchaeota archaeon]|nr:hypothetical protein [Candidatus Pacearchaeota archaeon]
MKERSEKVRWGIKSFYVFLALTVIGIIFYGVGYYQGDIAKYDYLFFGLFNIAWAIFILFFYSTTGILKILSILLSFVLGACAWFVAGSLLSYISRNKSDILERKKYVGKIVIIFSVVMLIVVFIPYLLITATYPEANESILESSIASSIPLFGTIFIIGVIIWISSKYKIIKVRKTK